jgi:hypothetical protein
MRGDARSHLLIARFGSRDVEHWLAVACGELFGVRAFSAARATKDQS